MAGITQEFSRFAHTYNTYNVIQAEVAKSLVEKLPLPHYETIVDIGCGSGEVYKNLEKQHISFDRFVALDASAQMLALHPGATAVEKIQANFNVLEAFKQLPQDKQSLFVSSSALQWSKDLDFTFGQLSKKSAMGYFAIFTSNTFKTLHQTADIPSPIHTQAVLKKSIQKYYHATFELRAYRLHFETVRDMFDYIKKSGVSGGEKQLSYKQTKKLMREYPLDYLEFEVLFVEGTSLESFVS